MENISLSGGMVSPNPCNGSIQIRIPGEERASDSQVSIYGSDGREIIKLEADRTDRVISMDVSSLESGLYILVLKTGEQIFTDRIVKH